MQIKLEIFNEDGSTYWIENFNDEISANKWLSEEETRPYWKSTYRHVITKIEEIPLVTVIPSVSPRQIRIALLSLGLTESMLDSAIETMPSPQKEQAMIAWKYSTSFDRNLPIVESIGAMLGLTADQLDHLWFYASNL